MSELTDKRTIVTVQPQIVTIDAIKNGGNGGQYFNGQMQIHQQYGPSLPANRPASHSTFDFWTREYPTFADYDDVTAPIGSKIHEYGTLEDEVVVYNCYCKVASNSWVSITNNSRDLSPFAGTIVTSLEAQGSDVFELSGLTGTIIPQGTVLTVDGNPVTVARDAVIDTGEAIVYTKETIAGTVAVGASVTITSINILSTDSFVELKYIATQEVILPDVAESKGSTICLKDNRASGTTSTTVVGKGSDAIEGGTTLTFDARFESVTLYSDGVLWLVTSNIGAVAIS